MRVPNFRPLSGDDIRNNPDQAADMINDMSRILTQVLQGNVDIINNLYSEYYDIEVPSRDEFLLSVGNKIINTGAVRGLVLLGATRVDGSPLADINNPNLRWFAKDDTNIACNFTYNSVPSEKTIQAKILILGA